MIMFPNSMHTYPGQVSPARNVIIDGINCGDLVEVQRNGLDRPEWMAVLTVRVAQDLFGSAEFTDRNKALNYIKAVYSIWSNPENTRNLFGATVSIGA